MKTTTTRKVAETDPNSMADGLQVHVEIAEPLWTEAINDTLVIAGTCARKTFAAALVARTSDGFRSMVPDPGIDRPCEVSVLLADDDQVASLNQDYRGKAGPTNVLSFSATGAPLPDDPSAPVLLGDIIIAYGVSKTEADAASVPLADHLSHLVVHGMLHLLGWDHETDDEAGRMESLETEILRTLNIPDPYQRP